MLRARIKNEEIAKAKTADEEILRIGSSQKRKDSVTAYTKVIDQSWCKEQLKLQSTKYLQEQISEDEVTKIIEEILQVKLFKLDFGKAMALVMPKLKGRADGSLVSK
jgi:hypothetical protein